MGGHNSCVRTDVCDVDEVDIDNAENVCGVDVVIVHDVFSDIGEMFSDFYVMFSNGSRYIQVVYPLGI